MTAVANKCLPCGARFKLIFHLESHRMLPLSCPVCASRDLIRDDGAADDVEPQTLADLIKDLERASRRAENAASDADSAMDLIDDILRGLKKKS